MPAAVRRAFAVAADFAVFQSDDPVTRNGAVVLDQRGRMYGGANSFVIRHADRRNGTFRDYTAWHERVETDNPFKYAVMCHAETNAIETAVRSGLDTAGSELVALYASCSNCAKAIVAAGIVHVHTLSDSALGGVPARWREEVDNGLMILRECGVLVTHWDAPGVRAEFLFDGRMVRV